MSHYLSAIAARSIVNDTPSLLSVTPAFNPTDTGRAGNSAEENTISDSIGQNEFVQQNIMPVQPVPLQNVQKSFITNTKEITVPEKNIQPSYLSKHIERADANEENNQVKNTLPESVSFKMEEPSQKIAAQSLDTGNNVNETIFVNKKVVSKIITEKKGLNKKTVEKKDIKNDDAVYIDEIISVKDQMITPSVKDEVQKKNKLQPNNSRIERITPIQPETEHARQAQRHNTHQQAPKLVIGKIIVEILPPIKPVPQKVITRVVQSTANNSNLKSNKLIFGLGQL